jgi:hypothetical protein
MTEDHGGQVAGSMSSPGEETVRLRAPARLTSPRSGSMGSRTNTRGLGGQPFCLDNSGPWWPNHYLGGQYQGGPYSGGAFPAGGNPPPQDWQTGWHNKWHPKIKTLMQSYLVQTNRCVHLAKNSCSSRSMSNQPSHPPKVRPPNGAAVLVLNQRPWEMYLQGLPILKGSWSPAAGRHHGRFCGSSHRHHQKGCPQAHRAHGGFANKETNSGRCWHPELTTRAHGAGKRKMGFN